MTIINNCMISKIPGSRKLFKVTKLSTEEILLYAVSKEEAKIKARCIINKDKIKVTKKNK